MQCSLKKCCLFIIPLMFVLFVIGDWNSWSSSVVRSPSTGVLRREDQEEAQPTRKRSNATSTATANDQNTPRAPPITTRLVDSAIPTSPPVAAAKENAAATPTSTAVAAVINETTFSSAPTPVQSTTTAPSFSALPPPLSPLPSVDHHHHHHQQQQQHVVITPPRHPLVGRIKASNGFLSWHRGEHMHCGAGGLVQFPLDPFSEFDELNPLKATAREVAATKKGYFHWWTRYYPSPDQQERIEEEEKDPLETLPDGGRPWAAHNCSHTATMQSPVTHQPLLPTWQCATTFAKENKEHEALLRFNLLTRCFNGVKPSSVGTHHHRPSNTSSFNRDEAGGTAAPLSSSVLPRFLFLGHSHLRNYYKAVCLELQRHDPDLFSGDPQRNLSKQECPQGQVHDACHFIRDGMGRIILAFEWSPYGELPPPHHKRLRDAKFDYIVMVRGAWDLLTNNTFPDDFYRNTLAAIRSVRAHYQPRRIVFLSPNHAFRDNAGMNTFYRDDSVPPLGLDPRGRNMDLQCNTLNRRGMTVEGTYCAVAAAASDEYTVLSAVQQLRQHNSASVTGSNNKQAVKNDEDDSDVDVDALSSLFVNPPTTGEEDVSSYFHSPSTSIEIMTGPPRMLSTGAGFLTKDTRGFHFYGISRRGIALLVMNQLCRPQPGVVGKKDERHEEHGGDDSHARAGMVNWKTMRRLQAIILKQKEKEAQGKGPLCQLGPFVSYSSSTATISNTAAASPRNDGRGRSDNCGPEPLALQTPKDSWNQLLMQEHTSTHSVKIQGTTKPNPGIERVEDERGTEQSSNVVTFLVTRLLGRIIRVAVLTPTSLSNHKKVLNYENNHPNRHSGNDYLKVLDSRRFHQARGYKPIKEVPGCSLRHTEAIIAEANHPSFFGIVYNRSRKLQEWTGENVWKPELTRVFVQFHNNHSSNCGQPPGAIFRAEVRTRTMATAPTVGENEEGNKKYDDAEHGEVKAKQQQERRVSDDWEWGPNVAAIILPSRELNLSPFPKADYRRVDATNLPRALLLQPRASDRTVLTPYYHPDGDQHHPPPSAWNSVDPSDCFRPQRHKVLFHGDGLARRAFNSLTKALLSSNSPLEWKHLVNKTKHLHQNVSSGPKNQETGTMGDETEAVKWTLQSVEEERPHEARSGTSLSNGKQHSSPRQITTNPGYVKHEFELMTKETHETVLYYVQLVVPHNSQKEGEIYPFVRRNMPNDVYSYTHIVVDWSSWFNNVDLTRPALRQSKISDIAHALQLMQSAAASAMILFLMPSEGTIWESIKGLRASSSSSAPSRCQLRKFYLSLFWVREIVYCACVLAQQYGVAVQPIETADLFSSLSLQTGSFPISVAVDNLALRLTLTICEAPFMYSAQVGADNVLRQTRWPLALSVLREGPTTSSWSFFDSNNDSDVSHYYYTLLPMPPPPKVLHQNLLFSRSSSPPAALFAAPGVPHHWEIMKNWSITGVLFNKKRKKPRQGSDGSVDDSDEDVRFCASQPFPLFHVTFDAEQGYRPPMAYLGDDDWPMDA